ncbi:MAG: GINS complex subunit [Vezdaea acicularis]|nr:MAG: GINS complex subunit [Vezdaea acicularis]
MDDIDDILASVSAAPIIPQHTRDLHTLTRLWVAERSAPEVLPWDAEMMGRVLEGIRKQIDLVEAETGNEDPRASFRLIIIQTELERWKYLVRSYLRARLAKIDKHALHYLRQSTFPSASSSPPLLNPSELAYARTHQSLLQAHYQASFLNAFPEQLRGLEDTAGGISMVEEPDLEAVVWVRVLAEGVEVEGERQERGAVLVVRWRSVRGGVLRGGVELV